MDSYYEPKLISLITQLMSLEGPRSLTLDWESIPLVCQIISLVGSMDLDSQPRPESKLMSLVTQTINFFYSMDLDSQPKPLLEAVSVITHLVKYKDLDSVLTWEQQFILVQTSELEQEPELMSLIYQILTLVISMNSEWEKLISVSPQVCVVLEEGKFHVVDEVIWRSSNKWECLPFNWKKFGRRGGGNAIHFRCESCNGKNHEEYEKAPVEIKHPLHPKHSLQLVLLKNDWSTRECYCCVKDLIEVFYYCLACDFALNIACAEKPPALSIYQPKWHEHTLAHFPRHAPITCDLCALPDFKSSPIYVCPPCDFVVHQSCLKLPRVIGISRHFHRISFASSFDKGDWSCGVCRKKIDNDYGGYSCIKDGCLYAAHSKCATQSNVWDGIDLEGVPEEIEEELEPFVRISDGIIQHFSHEEHRLRLDENTCRDYDEDKLCQACITPIYFGNFYSCMQCDFILHEACANLSRKIQHPVHPHMLTLSLVGANVNIYKDENGCEACHWCCTAGFFYECIGKGCDFQLHVQCASISEPLVHGSHIHPLFLTSKPEELRTCSVCYYLNRDFTETFNCIECEFSLCFDCATIPEKVRYKHDKHILTLSYGEKTSQKTYWCEICEGKINSETRFYMCDKKCCVTLHIKCLIGEELYMKPGSSWFYKGKKYVFASQKIQQKEKERNVDVLPNNQHMSRPFCSNCKKHCPYKILLQASGSVFCSLICFFISVR